jgi:hypothetical protein
VAMAAHTRSSAPVASTAAQPDSTARPKAQTGRPPLTTRPDFGERLSAVLPRLLSGEISQRQAQRESGISVRSILRYAKEMI